MKTGGVNVAKVIYLGNPQTKEFHSAKRHKPECNMRQIKNPVEFSTGRAAKKQNYDACAHCTRYWKSRR